MEQTDSWKRGQGSEILLKEGEQKGQSIYICMTYGHGQRVWTLIMGMRSGVGGGGNGGKIKTTLITNNEIFEGSKQKEEIFS